MIKKDIKPKNKIQQQYILKTSKVNKTIRRNPYLQALEDELKKMKEEETTPSPSSCPLQMCIPILAKLAPL